MLCLQSRVRLRETDGRQMAGTCATIAPTKPDLTRLVLLPVAPLPLDDQGRALLLAAPTVSAKAVRSVEAGHDDAFNTKDEVHEPH